MKQNKQHGTTFLELLIVVVIIGMLAAFAYPSYTQYVVDTKRTAAASILFQIADRQQQSFMDNKTYSADMTDLGFPANPLVIGDDGQRYPKRVFGGPVECRRNDLHDHGDAVARPARARH